jgi:hypothetical protein
MAEPASRSVLASLTVRAASLWILTGALFKLFVGTPNDLPPVVKDFAGTLGISVTLLYQLAIAIELSIAVPALLRPKLWWPFVAAQLAVFCAILLPMALRGETSCGCFGSKVTIPPWAMLAIDGTLLAALLAARPWRSDRPRRKLLVPIGAALVAAWALPFGLVGSGLAAPGSADPVAEAGRWLDWNPQTWAGKSLRESGLASVIDVELYPQDSTWVIYSPTCEHCAAYLRRVAGEFEQAPKMYVLVQLPVLAGAPVEVDLKPPGEEVALPADIEYVLTPPWVLEVAGGVVQSAEHPAD